MFFKALTVAAAVGSAVAQRPNDTSICDYYTTGLLMNNTAENQKMVLTLVVNTAIIGNYTPELNKGVNVPGILAPGEVNGTAVNLAPYFTGALVSSNDNGVARAVNWLDGGGAAPLMNNTPAIDDTSNQYMLITHLYSYFGALLGCTMMGNDAFPAYNGNPSQGDVHKFMDLNTAEVTYFINQVAMSAASFGVAQEDLMVVGAALNKFFASKCAPAVEIIPGQGAQTQSICQAEDCPTAEGATCAAYGTSVEPAASNSTSSGNTTSPSGGSGGSGGSSPSQSSGNGGATPTGPATAGTSTAAASTAGLSFVAVAGGLAALFL